MSFFCSIVYYLHRRLLITLHSDKRFKIRNFYGIKKLMARKFSLHVYGKSHRWSIVKMIKHFFIFSLCILPHTKSHLREQRMLYAGYEKIGNGYFYRKNTTKKENVFRGNSFSSTSSVSSFHRIFDVKTRRGILQVVFY